MTEPPPKPFSRKEGQPAVRKESKPPPTPPPAPASQPKMKAVAPPAPPPTPAPDATPPAPRSRVLQRPKPPAAAEAPEEGYTRRMATAPRGMGLQLKIMLAMGLTTLFVSGLIAGTVYQRASAFFEEEINTRGERLVEVLASVPAEFWLAAIHGDARRPHFSELLTAIGLVKDYDLKPEYAQLRNLLRDPFSTDWQAEIDRLITAITPDAQWKQKVEADPRLKQQYAQLVLPFQPLSQLLPLGKLGKGTDLEGVGVFDASRPDAPTMPGILPEGRMSLNLPAAAGAERISVEERLIADGNVRKRVRFFIRNPAPDEPIKLRHMVALSMRKIDEAKQSLLSMIVLPALASFAVALAIAAWLSHRITKPVRVLIGDINEVSSGNLLHQTAAHSGDEIGQLAASFNRMTAALRTAQQQELQNRALEHELGIASEIQTNLVPKSMLKVPGYDIGAYYRPSKEVGGDYYDFIEIDETRSGLIVADVSGKGVPGSLVMAMARAFIRMEAERSRNPSTADTLVRANRMLARDIKKGMFVTAIYGILDRTNHQIRISSAGHNPMILWRARTDDIVLVNPKGIALGLDKGPVFERTISEEIIQLEPGDRVVFYTDGTVEAMNERKEDFGDKRFYDLCRKLAKVESNQFLNLIMKALDEHKGAAPQHDDMTIVTFRRL
jgi:serine phosphatase RsbU (regulator of sigma subunit)